MPGSGVTLVVLQRPKPAAAASQTTAPEVPVVHPIVRQVTRHVDFTGRLEAAQTAEVRPRIAGQLARVLFKAGATVKQGDLLFEIDAVPFQAEQDRREADVRLAQLRLDRTAAELKEAKDSVASERRRLEAQQADAEAALKAAQEGLKVARLNLESTRLTAPISGRIGRPLIAVGSLASGSAPWATIDSVDPMCVVFNIDQDSVLNLRRNPPHVRGESTLPVLVGLPDEKDLPRKSNVESADTRIDPATGTARWRALLPNPDGLLMPGMFVHVRLVTSDPHQALLVPRNAVQGRGRSSSVFILSDQNIVHLRDVTVPCQEDDGMWVVEKGLTADDWVIASHVATTKNSSGLNITFSIVDGMTVAPKKPVAAAVPSSSGDKPPKAKGGGG
jgi:RND family efflux transporter MFP subunit